MKEDWKSDGDIGECEWFRWWRMDSEIDYTGLRGGELGLLRGFPRLF